MTSHGRGRSKRRRPNLDGLLKRTRQTCASLSRFVYVSRRLRGRSRLAAKMFSNNHTLDLAGAFANLVDLDVAPVARDGIFVHEAIAPVNLDRLIRRTRGGF